MSTYTRIVTLALILVLLTGTAALANEADRESTFDSIVENYLSIQTTLAGDGFEGIEASAGAIAKSTAGLAAEFDTHQAGIDAANADSLIKLLPGLQAAALALSKAETIDAARAAFGDLSGAMVNYRNLATGELPHVAYCSMVKKSWLQNGKTIANPYYGSAMLRCGSIVEK